MLVASFFRQSPPSLVASFFRQSPPSLVASLLSSPPNRLCLFIIRSTLINDIMAAATNSFTDIEEDDETSFDWETFTDPKRLKRFRSAGRSFLTKTERWQMQSEQEKTDIQSEEIKLFTSTTTKT
jgi:hypothetical protein